MRLACLAILALLAGCSGPSADPREPEPGTLEQQAAPLPDDLQVTGTMPPALGAPTSTDGSTSCGWPTAACQRHPFSLPRNATVTLLLDWDFPSSDLELHVAAPGSDDAIASSTSGLGRNEWLRLELEAGEYEAVVAAWDSAETPYALAVFFDEP